MKRGLPTTILSIVVGLGLLWYSAGSPAQPPLVTEVDQAVTDDGLHRVDPTIMPAAWVRPEFDLSSYTRVLLMPTSALFREVPERRDDARAGTEEFPLPDDRKEWLTGLWRDAVEARFARNDTLEQYEGDVSNVLVVQGFLVDVVSRIPPVAHGSTYTLVNNPWSAVVVLELRDAETTELLARTIDRRNAQGLLDVGTVWYRTPDLVERWAGVLTERLDELSELGGRPRATPSWWVPTD